MTDGRIPFATLEGYLGIAPPSTQEGDIVVVFSGYEMPFIIRKVFGGIYRLIGPCYVHGIMDGECVDRSKDFHITSFELGLAFKPIRY